MLIFFACCQQFVLVVFQNLFTHQQRGRSGGLIIFKLKKKDLVVSPKLNFVVIDTIGQVLVVLVSPFKLTEVLQAVNGYGKDLSR
jgi:hypothetical protein